MKTVSHTIDRWLSKYGIASRAETVEWIRQGRIRVSGRTVMSPDRVLSVLEGVFPEISKDGVILSPSPFLVLAMNKPRGILVGKDPSRPGQELDRLIERSAWGHDRAMAGKITPLGRLDLASCGLLLLTTRPGELAPLLDPSLSITREYKVQVRPALKPADLVRLNRGEVGEIFGFRPPEVRLLKENPRTSWLLITLVEGKNREIRKILSQLGYTVLHLIRTRVGDLKLGEEGEKKVGGFWDVTGHYGGQNGFIVDIILDRLKRDIIMEVKEAGG